jgi:TolB-like protein/Tfp pilus assembly protein PilF
MASLIPGYEYDVFISYRQKDNRGERWVSEFVESLKTELESTFKEEIAVYFDVNPHDALLETHDVDATLREKLKCLVFIPVISHTYCDPKSFAWNNEFCAFNRLAKEEKYGRDIRLPGGNVTSRILPVMIHEIEQEDKKIIEAELGGTLRSIEFIYRYPGVNRPLRASEDHPQDNLNKTYYRDQINKVANAIREIITGIRNFGKSVSSSVNSGNIEAENLLNRSGKSIIVLPFENYSQGQEDEYFSDGLTEEIISDLSQMRDLIVISRSSAMTFKGAKKKIREIANEVNVQYVVEGSVRKSGNSIKITVQLIDAFNDSHLWADKYTGTLDDVFSIQEKVSRSVVDALRIKLQREEKRTTSNLKAYDLYLLGRFYWNKRTDEGLEQCIRYFEQAIEHDEKYALAYSGLADAYYIGADWNYLDPATAYEKSKQLARKAISLDGLIAEAHATLAGIADNYEYDYQTAETLYKKAIQLNPNYTTGYQWYADFLVRLGRYREALSYISQALQLDPLSPVQNFACGSIHYYDRDWNNAIHKFDDTIRLDKDFPYVRFFKFLCFYHSGKMAEAAAEYRYTIGEKELLGDFDDRVKGHIGSEDIPGFTRLLIELENMKKTPSTRILSILYSLAGDSAKAIDLLVFNVNNLVSDYQYLNVEPSFSVLRSDPGFIDLLRKVRYCE